MPPAAGLPYLNRSSSDLLPLAPPVAPLVCLREPTAARWGSVPVAAWLLSMTDERSALLPEPLVDATTGSPLPPFRKARKPPPKRFQSTAT